MSQSAHAHGGSWDGDGAWTSRLAASLGHHANELLIVSIGAAVLLGLRPLPGAFGLTVPVALFGMVIASWLLMRAHDRRLCEACMSAMPLDAAQQAARYSKRFWMAHTGSEPRFLVPYLIVLLASNFATSTAGRALWVLMQLSMIYLILSYSTHRRLQPWCPWCRGGGGGGEDVDETPPVLPHDDRLLV